MAARVDRAGETRAVSGSGTGIGAQLELFEPVAPVYRAHPERLEIVPVGLALFGESLRARPSSPNYLALCAYHVERRASMYLKPAPNMFICYGCGEHGGPLRLVFENAPHPFDFLRRHADCDVDAVQDRERLVRAVRAEEERFEVCVVNSLAVRSVLELDMTGWHYMPKGW